MTISAVIIFEKQNKAIYVGTDGTPELVTDGLSRLNTNPGFDELLNLTDYRSITHGVGVPALSQMGELTIGKDENGKPSVTDLTGDPVNADYVYVVKATGVILHYVKGISTPAGSATLTS